MTTATRLEATRLYHREIAPKIVERTLAGRRVFVAASTIHTSRALMRQLQAMDLGPVWSAAAGFYWANGEERIDVAGAGRATFSSIHSTRILSHHVDVALVHYEATPEYLEQLLPALVLGGADEPELFEIDA